MSTDLEITPATAADYPIVRNLARFYVYDMSEHAGFDFPADGLFEAGKSLSNYFGIRPEAAADQWPDAWRGHPFLARLDDKLAGFALVREIGGARPFWDMGEFFVVRKFRRRGTGAEFAKAMFTRFPGRWEVRELPTNTGAQAFWRKVIGEFTHGAFSDARETFPAYRDAEFFVQRFESR